MRVSHALKVVVLLLFVAVSPVLATGSVYFLPQTADGVAGGLKIKSYFNVSNLNQNQTTVTMWFYQSNHNPWAVDLRCDDRPQTGGVGSSATFVLAPQETLGLYTAGTSNLVVGWTKVESGDPIVVSASYTAFDTNEIGSPPVWSAGVLPAEVSTEFSFDAAYSASTNPLGESVNTGIAVANVGVESAVFNVALYSRSGTLISDKNFVFLGSEHTAQFLTEIFDNVLWTGPFHGVVRISSTVNIAVMAMRTTSGAGRNVVSTTAVNRDSSRYQQAQYDLEPNSTTQQVAPLTLPAEVHGTMSSSASDDVDYFGVDLQAGDTLHVLVQSARPVSATPVSGTPFSFVSVALYDPLLTEISGDPASRDSPYRRFTVTTTAKYSLVIGSNGPGDSRFAYRMLAYVVKP